MSTIWDGVERRGKFRATESFYHPDDSLMWQNMGRRLIFATGGQKNDEHLRLVLCHIPNAHTPYVVWWENLNDSKRVNHPATFEGDYHLTLEQACRAFFAKATRYAVKPYVP